MWLQIIILRRHELRIYDYLKTRAQILNLSLEVIEPEIKLNLESLI